MILFNKIGEILVVLEYIQEKVKIVPPAARFRQKVDVLKKLGRWSSRILFSRVGERREQRPHSL